MLIDPPPANAYQVREFVRTYMQPVHVHRGRGEHVTDGPCWCEPMVLEVAEVRSLPIHVLTLILKEHFAVQ